MALDRLAINQCHSEAHEDQAASTDFTSPTGEQGD